MKWFEEIFDLHLYFQATYQGDYYFRDFLYILGAELRTDCSRFCAALLGADDAGTQASHQHVTEQPKLGEGPGKIGHHRWVDPRKATAGTGG